MCDLQMERATMFIYFGKRFDATQAGQRVVDIRCDQCGCEYFYHLTRVGTGAATAPYYLGMDSAERRAQKQAETDLQRRLAQEADLVPCPKCNWINDDAVRKYRLGRCRQLNKLALWIAVVGCASALMCSWPISIGPPPDRAAVPYILVGGPLFFLALAGCVILFRNFLRSQIRPNRHFPIPPELPPDTPRAVIADKSTVRLLEPNPTDIQTLDEVKSRYRKLT
jgi:hypothetical protein